MWNRMAERWRQCAERYVEQSLAARDRSPNRHRRSTWVGSLLDGVPGSGPPRGPAWPEPPIRSGALRCHGCGMGARQSGNAVRKEGPGYCRESGRCACLRTPTKSRGHVSFWGWREPLALCLCLR
jgi:hypothetical protein